MCPPETVCFAKPIDQAIIQDDIKDKALEYHPPKYVIRLPDPLPNGLGTPGLQVELSVEADQNGIGVQIR